MGLLEKYLQAVKFWLPNSQQADIIAELRDDIHSEVEERESSLGRSLTDKEWEAILKQRGRPLLVAEKYLPQRWLIGPVLFPAYWFVLKIVLLCYFAPCIVVWVGLIVLNAQYRMNHLGWASIGDMLFLLRNSLISCTVVTIIFAIIERAKDQNWVADDWSPRKLPAVRNTKRIPRSGSAFGVIFGTILGIWWLKILWTLTVFQSDGLTVTLPPAWHKYFWGFLLIFVVNNASSAYYFMRPYWTRARLAMRAGSNLLTALVLLLAAREFSPLMTAAPAVLGGKVASISWAITFGLAISFTVAFFICVGLAIVDIWRALRTGPLPRLNHRVAV
jgi:hypothetical protein